MIAGCLLGIVLAGIRTREIPVLNGLAKTYINGFRSIPLVMVLLGFYLVVPAVIKPLFSITGDIRLYCALIAFSLFEAAYIAEILRSGFNSIPKSQAMACKAMGLSTIQAYRQVLVPQALKNSFPVLVTQFIILLQDTSLVYVIGLTDFFGGMVKIGEMNGSTSQMIVLASTSYLVVFVLLQRAIERMKR